MSDIIFIVGGISNVDIIIIHNHDWLKVIIKDTKVHLYSFYTLVQVDSGMILHDRDLSGWYNGQ